MCQNKLVWSQSVDSPNLKLRIEASSLWLVLSRKTQRDKVRVGRPMSFLFRKHQTRGAAWAWLRTAAPGWEPAPGGPVLVQRPHHLLFGTRNLREGGAGTQAFRKPEKKAPTMSPCSQSLAPGSTAACDKACTFATSSSSLGCGVREPAGSPALAIYCDVSTPLPRPPFWTGFPRPPQALSSVPCLSPCLPHPLLLSPHLQIILIILGT